MGRLPTGTVSLLFSDMEASTLLLARLGPAFADALDAQRGLLRRAWSVWGGTEMGTEGDSFFVVFGTAEAAVAAAVQGQRDLASYAWPRGEAVRVRMGVHTGAPAQHGDGYVGLDVHRAARIAASAHGGQVVVSAATAELASSSLPAGVKIRDLGSHRLKDLPRPERLFQMVIDGLVADFPPLKVLGATSSLPRPATPMVGRRRELDEVSALLLSPDVRLVTLTGPGGTGKTRLAIELAWRLSGARPDGGFFVALAETTAPEQMWTTLAEALDIPPESRVASSVLEQVASRDALVVLDNLEQIPGADDVVAQLLDGAQNITVVATSRHPLHVPGERQYPVRPLQVPDVDQLGEAERAGAVELLVQHARSFKPDFMISTDNVSHVVMICRRLDGLPLAIELAAARIKLLGPAALLARLDKALDLSASSRQTSERQKTLRDTIAWSYGLLNPAEQSLFRRLGVFAGDASLDAVEAVASFAEAPAPDLAILDTLELVAELVDASVVSMQEGTGGEPRIAMLQTVNSFARDQLAAHEELDQIRAQHFAYYLAAAREWEPLLKSGRARWARGRFESDLDNFRAALGWALPADAGSRQVPGLPARDGPGALGLCSALDTFWYNTGYLGEERHWLEQAVARGGAPSPDMAHGLTLLASVAVRTGDLEAAMTHATHAVKMCRELGFAQNLPAALRELAWAEAQSNPSADISAPFREALEAAEQSGDPAQIAETLLTYGFVETSHERRLLLLQRARDLYESIDHAAGACTTQHNMACTLRMMGRVEEAEQLMRSIIPQNVELHGPGSLIEMAEDYAAIVATQGENVLAARLLGAAEATRHQYGVPRNPQQATEIAEPIQAARATLTAPAWEAAYQTGYDTAIEDVLTQASAR